MRMKVKHKVKKKFTFSPLMDVLKFSFNSVLKNIPENILKRTYVCTFVRTNSIWTFEGRKNINSKNFYVSPIFSTQTSKMNRKISKP